MAEICHVVCGLRQTEKSARLTPLRQYILQVDLRATKGQIKQAVEALFKVSVQQVNTQVYEGKWRRLNKHVGRRPGWKKAIVTLAEGHAIELK